MSRILFIGSKQSGFRMLKAVQGVDPDCKIISIDDRSDTRTAHAEFANEGATIVRNKDEANKEIEEISPEFVFVHGWYWIIPANLTERFVMIGTHNSLLPKYRGGAPLVWSMINGECEVGSSIFRMTEGMDEGVIYDQVRVSVGSDDHVGDILPKIDSLIESALPSIVKRAMDGSLRGQRQNSLLATYCGQRKPEDGLINWHKPAAMVHDFIRAQSAPYPGAFSLNAKGRFNIKRSSLFPQPYFGSPGQVVEERGGRHIIACGDGQAVSVISDGLKVGMRLSSEPSPEWTGNIS